MKRYQPDFDLTKLGFFSGAIEIDKKHQIGLLDGEGIRYFVPMYYSGRAWVPYTHRGKAIAYGSYQPGGAAGARESAIRHIHRSGREEVAAI